MIKAVLFDADHTLFHVSPSVGYHYSAVCIRFGITVDACVLDEKLLGAWNAIHREYLNASDDYRTSAIRERQIWRQFMLLLLNRAGVQNASDELLAAIYHEFAHAHTRQLAPGTLECLEQLKQRNLHTGVLSNNDERLINLLRELGVAHLLNHILPSSVLGFKKPALACFTAAQALIKYKPTEILYVGDSYEEDYLPAVAAGWNAVWFNPFNAALPQDDVRSIGSMAEVSALVSL